MAVLALITSEALPSNQTLVETTMKKHAVGIDSILRIVVGIDLITATVWDVLLHRVISESRKLP